MRTDEDEGGVQVFVVLFRIISVKLFGFPAVNGEEVGPGIVGSKGFEELFKGGMEAGGLEFQCISNYDTAMKWAQRTTWDRFERPLAPAGGVSSRARVSPSVAIVAG